MKRNLRMGFLALASAMVMELTLPTGMVTAFAEERKEYEVVEFGTEPYGEANNLTKEEMDQMLEEANKKEKEIEEASKYGPVFEAKDEVRGTIYTENKNLIYSTDNGRSWTSVEENSGRIGGGIDEQNDILYKNTEDGEIHKLEIKKMEKNPLDRNYITVNNGVMQGIPNGYEVKKEGSDTWIKVDNNTFVGEANTSYIFRKSARGSYMASDDAFVVTVTKVNSTPSEVKETIGVDRETKSLKDESEYSEGKKEDSVSTYSNATETKAEKATLKNNDVESKSEESVVTKKAKKNSPTEKNSNGIEKKIVLRKGEAKKLSIGKKFRGRKIKSFRFYYDKSKAKISKSGVISLKKKAKQVKVKVKLVLEDNSTQVISLLAVRK